MAKATWTQFFRCRLESTLNQNPATPATTVAEWNIGGNGGGANGWMDLPVTKDSDGLQPKSTVIYPTTKSGQRSMNTALPVAGAYPLEKGNLDIYVYPELIDRIFLAVFGSVARTPTAGTAALAATLFASVATLDTQPDGTEQLKFTIASSTAATGASINIIQSAATVETITIGTSASSVDGDYYSKGRYDGTTNAITFTVAGTVTSGTVAISGVDYVTNAFTMSTSETPQSLQIEQGGRLEAGSGNSEFLSGVVIPEITLTYDRAAPDNLLMCNAQFQSWFPTAAAAGTYANDASDYYKPIAGWTASVNLDDVSYAEVVSANFTIRPGNELFVVSSGNQNPSGAVSGEFEVFGTATIIPADESRWDDYTANTVRDLEFDFVTPFYVVDTTGYRVLLTMTQCTIEDYTRNQQSMVGGAEIAFRAIYNTTDSGAMALTTRCGMPV